MVSAGEFLKWLNVFNIKPGGGGSITVPVSMGNGGTGASLAPNNGSLFYSNSTNGALLPTSAFGVLVTNSLGVPSISQLLPSGLTVPGYLALSGGTMTGNIILVGDPTSALEPATKQYVDNIATGFIPVGSVYAASTANLTGWVYTNGSSGVGATLVAPATGIFTVDGVSPPVNQFFLYKDDSTFSGVANGIYQVTTNAGGLAAVLTRATYYDTPSQILIGTLVSIQNGTVNQGSTWYQTATVSAIGTDPIEFSPLIQPSSFLMVVNNLSDVASKTAAFNNIAPSTTLGDTIYFNGINNVRLGIGSNGNVFSVVSGIPAWIANPALLIANNLSDLASIPTAVANLGLTIGTNVEAWSAALDQIAAGTWVGATSITTLGTITTGTWNGSVLIGTYGGTGVNNGLSTITIGGNVTFSGAHTFVGNLTANTNVTFPTSGTLATTGQIPTPAALTETDDTNVTLTLGGTPSTALLQAVSLTLGWTGTLAGSRGGLGAAITASNGGIYYSTASNGALLAGTATAQQILLSGATGAPQWSTTVYPLTNAINTIMYASSANVLGVITPVVNAGLLSNGTGVPAWVAYTGTGAPVLANSPALITPALGTPSAIVLTNGSGLPLSTGVTGVLGLSNGGSNANLTASNGGIVYSTGTAMAILPGTATAGLPLLSGNSTTPSWGAFTLGLGGAFATAGVLNFVGAFSTTINVTAATNITLPTSGTLATTAQIPTLPVPLASGGTGANLTASNGGIFYSGGSAGAILAGTATPGQMLQSGANTAPSWTTNTWPSTTAINSILYASSANVIGAITPAASSILISSAGNVPSWGTTLPSAVQTNITNLGTITVGTWNAGIITGTYGGTGVNNGANTITIGGNVTYSGAHTVAWTVTGNTTLTLPTTGTLATLTTPGRFLNVQFFKTTGTYTPTAGTTTGIVLTWASGGSGGGSSAAGIQGSGGGAGAFAMSTITSITTETFTIGASAAGVTGNTNGNNGHNTSFGSLVIAAAGSGGSAAGSGGASGGAGGLASSSTGQLTLSGGSGAGTGNSPANSIGSGGTAPMLGMVTFGAASTGTGISAPANTGGGGAGTDNSGTSGASGAGLGIIIEFT